MSTGLQAGLISLVALLGSLLVWQVAGPPVRLAPEEVELSTVVEEWGGEVLWIDARKRDDWKRNGLEGSVLINLDPAEDFDSLVAEALPRIARNERAVVYCGDPGCGSSIEVTRRLREYQLGPEVFALHGGWDVLAESGLVSGSR